MNSTGLGLRSPPPSDRVLELQPVEEAASRARHHQLVKYLAAERGLGWGVSGGGGCGGGGLRGRGFGGGGGVRAEAAWEKPWHVELSETWGAVGSEVSNLKHPSREDTMF